MLQRISGHAWTILGDASHRLRPPPAPVDTPWEATVEDPSVGAVTLRGRLATASHADTAVLVVHGLGGSARSGYCVEFARACAARGWTSLRVNLRSADGHGEDLYHAGLCSDLEAALTSAPLRSYARVFIVGVSLGGHMALHLARRPPNNLHAVAAISSPLDLAVSCAAMDRRRSWGYRHIVLNGLKHGYRSIARARPERIPTAVQLVQSVRTLAQWDGHTVVPRFGFASVAEYHAQMSVGPHLAQLQLPTLYLGAKYDPMVPAETVLPSLRNAPKSMRIEMHDHGGHVAMPGPAIDPKLPNTCPEQVLAWFASLCE